MSPVTALASDRRFRRAQMKPVRRRGKWYALARRAVQFAALAAVLAYGVSRAPAIAARASVLRVNRIVIHGNERLSQGDVLAILTGLQGESLLWTDLHAWRRRLLASSWVQDADLRRSLPSTIDIVISERRPMGIGRMNGDMYLVDDHGVIIDQYGPQYAQFDLPMIDGLSTSPAGSGTTTDAARAELAAHVIAGDSAVIRLGEDRFLPRIESYLQVAAALRERVSDIDYVDLRFDDRIYVRPVKAKAARSTTAAGRRH